MTRVDMDTRTRRVTTWESVFAVSIRGREFALEVEHGSRAHRIYNALRGNR